MKQMPGYTLAEPDLLTRKVLKHSLTTGASVFLTICEQLRFTYDSVAQLPEGEIKSDLTEKLIDAFSMGKKMNARLARYKRETGDTTGSAGSNLIKLKHTEERAGLRNRR